MVCWSLCFSPDRVEGVGVQHLLALVDVLDEALHAAGAGEVVFLAGALVQQADAHAVVQEAQLAQALGQDLVVEVEVFLEDLGVVRQEVHLGAALVGVAEDCMGENCTLLPSGASAFFEGRFCTKPRRTPARAPCRRGAPSGAASSTAR
jgi:hypothetical protein